MSSEKSLDTADCVVFGVLTAVGYIVGIYFSFARRRQKLASSDGDVPGADYEAFLGGQSLPSVALAVSVVASVANGMNVYLRMRFDNKVGITASVVYFVLSQTLGAVGIYSAAIGLATMLSVPLLYSNIAIGVAGTIYTALGGLRGVVWADCVQALVMFLAPLTIIGKVLYDSNHVEPALRSMSDLNVTEYMFRANLNLTLDENIWSCFIGGLPYIFVRVGFDQMVVQRFMAARSEHDAKRIAVVSSVFVVFFFFVIGVAGGTIIYWYRDCDPLLSGAIKNYDQVVPYYLKQSLSEVTAMRGLFLAGLLGATTSTVSSVVNSHAATFYIDVIAPYYKLSEEKALIVMRLLAFASGAIMTLFAIAVPALGTATRLFLNFYASASGPFSALVILAVTSPWVNSKGAAWASLVVCAFQLWHAVGRSMSSVGKPPVFPGTLDRCPTPQNVTVEAAKNLYNTDTQSAYVFPLYRLSFFWSSFFGALLTITLAVALSFATGGIQKSQKKVRFVSPLFTEFWKKLNLVGEEYEVNAPMTLNGVVSSGNKSDEDERTKLGTEMSPVRKERTSSEVTIVHASECRT
ncbi:sodium-coupled monocarboxylate transporter 2 isoform X2 [Rhipicephalus microplus]|uniref:sodium-coupled monocarboxylate transporter 2 isoform X2 n=1 Tax=Rhipicephalus microplus TaxID=6941 RepID=UPI003F6BF95E